MIDTPNTKRVYLKLQAPKSRLDLYTNAIITAIERGWERKAESKLVVHNGQTMVKVTLSREVPLDSEYPDEDVWDCHPESYVFYDNEKFIEEKSDLQVKLEQSVQLVKDGVLEPATVTKEDLFNSLESNLPDTQVGKVVQKSSSGFEMRPYTLEELQKMKWTRLTQLGADLGIDGGNKQQRELKIVKASQEQWGDL